VIYPEYTPFKSSTPNPRLQTRNPQH